MQTTTSPAAITDAERERVAEAARPRTERKYRGTGYYPVTVGGYVIGGVQRTDCSRVTYWNAIDTDGAEVGPTWATTDGETRADAVAYLGRTDAGVRAYREAAWEGTFGTAAEQAERQRREALFAVMSAEDAIEIVSADANRVHARRATQSADDAADGGTPADPQAAVAARYTPVLPDGYTTAHTRDSSRVHALGRDGYRLCAPITVSRGLGPGVLRTADPTRPVTCANCARSLARITADRITAAIVRGTVDPLLVAFLDECEATGQRPDQLAVTWHNESGYPTAVTRALVDSAHVTTRAHTEQCVTLGHAELLCGAQDDGRMHCVAQRDADLQKVAATVAWIRDKIIPAWGIGAFRQDPGGLIAYHMEHASPEPDDGTAAAAIAVILGPHPTPRRGMRFVHARYRQAVPGVRCADSPRTIERVSRVTDTTVFFVSDDRPTGHVPASITRDRFAQVSVGAYLPDAT